MLKALFYDPYVDTLGGGERYTFTAAKVLLNQNWSITFAWPDTSVFSQAQSRFGIDLGSVKVDPKLFYLFTNHGSLLERFKLTHNFDLCFFVSDGSIPILFCKKNILHYQVPFTKINQPFLVNKAKLLTLNSVIVNSHFTKQVIDKLLNIHTTVIYPPIDIQALDTRAPKENIILSVGRFVSPSHAKRQDVLIQAFRDLSPQGWKLVLAGGHQGSQTELTYLKNMAKDQTIEFVVNPNYQDLRKLYHKSKIYWHAAGFEVDDTINPEAVEHFGITTVEAMAAGCVPIVVGKGGQKEIVTSNSGFLWQSIDDLVIDTQQIINDPQLLDNLSLEARKRATQFSQQNFTDSFLKLIHD